MALISLGSSPIHYFSKSAVSTSMDLVDFQPLAAPFPTHNQIQHACVDPTGTCVAASNSGLAATSSDFVNWQSYELNQRQQQFLKITHAEQFVAVGFQRMPNLNEQATVFTSMNGVDQFSWWVLQVLPSTCSQFLDVTVMQAGQFVAVGINQDVVPTQSLLSYGTLNTAWELISLPSDLQGGIYSVKYDQTLNRIWLGGRGWIATGIWAHSQTVWTKTLLGEHPINLIEYHAGKVICASRDQVFQSGNLFDYDLIHILGHSCTAITVYNDQIILGTESFLNAYSAFVLNTTDKTVQGIQSGVSARAFVII